MQYNALQTIQAFEAGQGQRKQREYDAGRQKLGNALAMGDLKGGASTAFGMGDIETGMALQTQQRTMLDAEAEKKRTGLMRYGMGLLQTPQEQREAMRPQIAQTLAQIGVEVPEDQLAQMDLSDAAIQATLQSLQDPESLMKQYQAQMNPEFKVVGDSLMRIQGNQVTPAYTAPQKPQEQWQEYTPPGGIPGLFIKSAQTGEIKRVAGPQSGGIRVGPDGSVMIGGPVDGLGYGSAPRGQDAAIAFDRDGNPVVTPGPQQEAYNKALRGLDEFTAQNSIVLEDIDRALGSISGWSTGAGAALKDLPIIGGITPAGQLESLLETIQANVGFDKLQAMREASPTGGALGAVTERELAFLQAVFGSLRQDTSPENVRYNLTRLREHMAGREQRLREALATDFPSLATTAQRRGATNQQLQTLNDDEAAELEQLRRELRIE